MTVDAQRLLDEQMETRLIVNAINAAEWSASHTITIHAQGEPVMRLPLCELQAMVSNVASWLFDLGLKRHDRVGILSCNRLEWVLLDLAALQLGIVTAGFEPELFAKRSNLVAAYGLRLLVHDRDCEAVRASNCKSIPVDVVLGVGLARNGPVRRLPPVHYGPGDVSTIKFTSGSTGEAKALAATVGSIDQSLRGTQALFNHRPGDRLFVFLPLSLLQQRYWIYSAIVFGHDVVVTAPALALEALRLERPTVVMGVPAFFAMLKDLIGSMADGDAKGSGALHKAARMVLGPNIRYLWTGSAPAHPDVLAFFDDACGIPLFEGYGMNETCIVTKNHPGAHRRGSAGRPLNGVEVTIDPGGGIRVRRRHPVNTAYLYAPPGASERIFSTNGSVVTGDLGCLDADGYLYVHGRADDVVVLQNGRNVAVRPIEERIGRQATIAQVMVLGTGCPSLTAVVHPRPGADPATVREVVLRAGRAKNGEAVTTVIFASEPFSTENGLLTSQGKLRRAAIARAYETAIDKAHGENR